MRGSVGLVSVVVLVAALTCIASSSFGKEVAPPANAPAGAQWNAPNGRLLLRYHDTVILEATIGAEDADGREVEGIAVKFEPTESLGDKVEQYLKFVLAEPREGVELVLRGTVTGGSGSNCGLSEFEVLSDIVLKAHSLGLR
jgi:hypothetical protein